MESYYVGVYVRLSREDGDNQISDSITNQKRLINEYIESKDYLLLFKEYVDDGFTGTNFNRPGFKEMINDVESGKINCIIVKDLSRFGRDYITVGEYLERYFMEKEIRFIALNDNIDSHESEYDMLMPVKNIFNAQYSKDISKKVQTSFKVKQKAGEFVGAFAGYGYKKHPTIKNKLIIDEYAANVVRKIYSLYISGTSRLLISKILNNENILCPSEYKKTMGLNYTNNNRLELTKYWTYSTIDRMLMNEMYIGNMVQGKTKRRMKGKAKTLSKNEWIIVKETHEPIIDIDTWNKAQHLRSLQKKHMNVDQNISLFAGIIKCGDCGRSMIKKTMYHKDHTPYYRYYCGTYAKFGIGHCSNHSIDYDVIYNIVKNDFNQIIKNIKNLNDMVKKSKQKVPDVNEINEKKIQKLLYEETIFNKRKKRSYEDYQDDLLTKDEYISFKKDIDKKLNLIRQQISDLERKKTNNIKNIMESEWIHYLLNKKEIMTLERKDIFELIKEIRVYENNRIEITYNFSDEYDYLFSKNYSV